MEKNIFLQVSSAIRDWLSSTFGLSPAGVDAWMGAIATIAVIVFLLLNALILVWGERRICAFFQMRKGPNRLGPFGLFQGIADVLKLLSKEDIIPNKADKWVFRIASIAVVIPAIMVFAVIPFDKDTFIADLNVGIFYIISIASTSTLAFLMAGWSSNNKYSLLGGMRTVAQMISYEIALVFSLLGVVMITGSLKLGDIVEAQRKVWFIIPQFVAFFTYFIAATAETNRAPFDQIEGEQEIIGGVYTEYSGMRWALFFVAEYANLVAVSSIAASCFLGGYLAPFGLPGPGWLWFILKVYFMIFLFMWIRWTFPRVRIDHMMAFGWKFLIPVSLANILFTGIGLQVLDYLKRVGW